jgi:hypothetical protein
VGAAAALFLVSSPASAETTATPDTATLRSIEAQVAQIRGLKPLADPELRLLDHTSLNTYLADQFTRNYLPTERESDQAEMVALGLIQPTDDFMQIELNLLNNQVVGVYDPDLKSLFVVSDEGDFGPAARITYAHEFNHALQDQYYDLNKIAPKHPDSNDHSLAIHGLVEGDAIMLQTMWAQQNLSADDLVQLTRGSGGADAGLAQAPLIVRSELLFPYTDGFSFVRQTYRLAGNSYAAVNQVFENPPESTAQVLHPDKYRAHIHPIDVQLGDIAASVGRGWRRVGSGVLGELDTRVLLEQWGTPPGDANRMAAAWRGDRWQLVEANGHPAIALKSTWETPSAAADFFSAYTSGLHVRFSNATVEESSGVREVLTDAGAVSDVRLDGRDVLVVIAFDRDTSESIVGAITSFVP